MSELQQVIKIFHRASGTSTPDRPTLGI